MVWGPRSEERRVGEERGLPASASQVMVAAPRLQLAKGLLARSWVKLTVAVGGVGEGGVLWVQAAVLLMWLPTGTIAGEQLTAVVVSCWRAVTTKVPELLRWLVSPP